MAINTTKEKVCSLRITGMTFAEINKTIGKNIPKSTLSYWCKDVELPASYQTRVRKMNLKSLSKAREKALTVNKENRQNYLRELEQKNLYLTKALNKDSQKIALAMLYLGEGAKWAGHNGLSLGSSDPEIVKLYITLLKTCYNIDVENLRCRVQARADQDINELQGFWSRITGIPISHFYKTVPDARTVGKKTRKEGYKGVCVVSGGGTEVQLELQLIAKIISRALSSVG